jgi:prophage tail gpP-like protein
MSNGDVLPPTVVEGQAPAAVPTPVPRPNFPPNVPGFNTGAEIAVITVNGKEYAAWESVFVYNEVSQQIQFRFTASEGSETGTNFAAIGITPGDACTVTMAGQLAVTGFVTETQRYYDANRHLLLVAGHSQASDSSVGSIMGSGGQFRDQSFMEIADQVLKPYGISLNVVGGQGDLDKKFDNVQVAYGESPWELLDRLARLRGAYLGDNEKGQIEVVNGLSGLQAQALVEGQNILEARCTVVDFSLVGPVIQVTSQSPGNDQNNMSKVAQPVGQAVGQSTRYRPFRMVAELPTHIVADLTKRAQYEVKWREQERITADITVQGWLDGSGNLWRVNSAVQVVSPMLLLGPDDHLAIWAVTRTQDSVGGTRTLITAKNQAAWTAGVVQVQ